MKIIIVCLLVIGLVIFFFESLKKIYEYFLPLFIVGIVVLGIQLSIVDFESLRKEYNLKVSSKPIEQTETITEKLSSS